MHVCPIPLAVATIKEISYLEEHIGEIQKREIQIVCHTTLRETSITFTIQSKIQSTTNET